MNSTVKVVDDQMRVIGVVSEADMLPKEGLDEAEGITAGDLMTSPAVTVSPDDTVAHAAGLMCSRGFKRLPVLNAAGQLAGIVSRIDVLAVFDRPDTEIRKEITGLILTEQLQDPRRFKVTVKDGIVTLHGEPETAGLGHELVRKARHVQGVVAVRDRLTYPEPGTVAAPGFFVNPSR